MDERWSSQEIIEARIIIHNLYVAAKLKMDDNQKLINKKIGEDIVKLNKSKNSVKQRKFICLLNLLDFMETIGHLCSKNLLSTEEVRDLCGFSMKFNYQIFERYIRERRKRHKVPKLYQDFENLYNKLKESKEGSL